ncbi:HAD family hydrolase [Vibrio coralliilyticus]|uniref:HAD family hydrolase n=1 Tax=Vibrio coralliilyticus TaxID=190893 RepID=UPI001560E2D3|nr:HAD-IA family hydrolase [Vibrio coralliilyticus]NRF63699.1 HAD-IA family hydrolase [Vibrio coralliilyticus]
MKLVIFDCDGTLVDSEFLCNLVLEHQLAELGVKSTAEELLGKYRGAKLAVILSSLESDFSISLPASFEQEYRNKVSTLFEQHLTPNIGGKEVLESLSIPYCIASSVPRNKIEKALKVKELANHFEHNIYSSYEVGSWKPEPDLFLHAAKEMGFRPEDCYVVEDSLLGLEAATNAKMKAVYYAPQVQEKNQYGAFQIQNMLELAEIIT